MKGVIAARVQQLLWSEALRSGFHFLLPDPCKGLAFCVINTAGVFLERCMSPSQWTVLLDNHDPRYP